MTMLETLATAAAALLVLGTLLRGTWWVNRRIVQIISAVTELSPNGGNSVKDTVQQNADTAARTEQKVDQLSARFDQHLRDHARPRWRPVRRR